jgi:hypothetical protein
LRLLCPNCHSQTETYCRGTRRAIKNKCIDCGIVIQQNSTRCFPCGSKNRKRVYKIVWPDELQLMLMVSESGYAATGKKLGVSDNAVRKRINKFVEEERIKMYKEANEIC